MRDVVDSLESIVAGSVAITARALADAAPDLTILQWRALVLVADGGLAVRDLAVRIGATSSATSRLVGRLAGRGLVTTVKAGDDRRVTWVVLTPSGEDLRRRVLERRAIDLETIAGSPSIPSNADLTAFADEFDRVTEPPFAAPGSTSIDGPVAGAADMRP
jgi:DNA-binding MarR family transcriptional regulator